MMRGFFCCCYCMYEALAYWIYRVLWYFIDFARTLGMMCKNLPIKQLAAWCFGKVVFVESAHWADSI